MPNREETEYSQRGTGRESDERDASLREPVEQPAMFEGVPVTQDGNEEPKQSIDDIVANLIIHEHKPIENLPTMSAPELKLIGRCVSLSIKQTVNGVTAPYYYTGLVSAVTAAAVTLMYVNRYTEVDFQVYKEREKVAVRAGTASAQEMTQRNASHTDHHHSTHGRSPSSEIDQDQQHVGVPAHGCSVKGEASLDHNGELTGQRDAAAALPLHVDAAGSLAPAVVMNFDYATEGDKQAFNVAQDGEVEESSNDPVSGAAGPPLVLRPRHFRNFAGSVGPLPYVSFLRKNIHDVAFGRDPRSSFYSLFQDPSKQLLDMQYLRMFVRRYLVHTSEGNNPRQVPMYAFLTVRGACPGLDHEVANQLVREELPGLMKADKSIEKEKKRNRNREVRRDLAIQEYHAPPGPFSRTGILYLTHTPQSTFLSGVVIVLFAVAFVIFLAVTLAVVADALMMLYLTQIMSYFIASLVIWLMTGVSILLHGVIMHIPLRDDLQLMVARALLTLGAVACSIMTLVMLLGRLSNRRLYHFMELQGTDLLCNYYNRHQCSGLTEPCTSPLASTDALCTGCPATAHYPSVCYHSLWSQLQILVIPLLVFCVFNLLAEIHSISQFVKLWLMARALNDRVRS